MITHTRIAALCALTFGLAACDSSQEPGAIAEAETAVGVFEANAFPTGVNIVGVSNRPDAENRDRILKLNRSLDRRSKLAGEPRFDRAVPGGVKSFQQVAFAGPQRDFVGTFDGNDGFGKLIRTNRRGTIEAVTNVGRRPKGVIVDAVIGGSSYIGVADFGINTGSVSPARVLFYNQEFAQGEAPVARLTNFGTGGRVWDLFYSQEADILFLSKTNGEVAAYDNFSAAIAPVIAGTAPGSSVMPTREFAISNKQDMPQSKRSLNLHGIAYDAETDILIVSDVANPANPLSGRIYTIANGSTAGAPPNASGTQSNLVSFRARIRSLAAPANNNTLLGNPVDILGFGENLYVAAKGTNRVLRFDNILTATGNQGNRAPDAQREVIGAESVSLFLR